MEREEINQEINLLAEKVKGFEVLPFGRTVNLRQASVQ